jgi:A/G-specific adenine glycosylase
MLQQTRARAVVPYYERFLARFPTVEALAAATEPDVLALWSGLGYYSRARNLRLGAQQIVAAGGFPRQYDAILRLPGVGDYTAAAIASMAFHLPNAALDGNVMRVVARVQNDAADIGAGRTRQRFRAIAQAWIDEAWLGLNPPGLFNQALMELGATVCLPRNPLCLVCPVAACCRGRQEGVADQLPVKLRKTVPVKIDGVLLVVRQRGRILLRQRPAGARRMAGFWDLPAPEDLLQAHVGKQLGEIRHTITHHHYTLTVRAATVRAAETPAQPAASVEFAWFRPGRLAEIPLSTTARKALKVAGIL